MYPQPSAPMYYPGQPMPPRGPMPGPMMPGMPPFGMGMLPPHLMAFTQHYDGDQTWDGTPSDVPKEMGLIDQRKNDLYPQGRDNCLQFLRECQMKGLNFKIKAKKTRPYWTWYFELNHTGGGGGYAPGMPPMPPMPMPSMGILPPHLGAFAAHYDADQTWECSAADVPKEMGLIEQRRNDMYPQGRDNCLQFLRECQMRGLAFRVKAKKTSPYWTWYFEVNGGGAPAPAPAPMPMPMPGFPGMPMPGFHGLPPHLMAFTQHHDADQTWECSPSDVPKEMGLIGQRKNDMYPQGRDNCMQFLRECQMKGLRFKVKAKKTRPYWTWFYEI